MKLFHRNKFGEKNIKIILENNIYLYYMVRPGLKRLVVAQRVKVQPNKTGTSKMLGMPFNKMSGIVYNQEADNRYNNVNQSKTFNNEYTAQQKADDLARMCTCKKKF